MYSHKNLWCWLYYPILQMRDKVTCPISCRVVGAGFELRLCDSRDCVLNHFPSGISINAAWLGGWLLNFGKWVTTSIAKKITNHWQVIRSCLFSTMPGTINKLCLKKKIQTEDNYTHIHTHTNRMYHVYSHLFFYFK